MTKNGWYAIKPNQTKPRPMAGLMAELIFFASNKL